MGKLLCLCGNLLSDVGYPCYQQGYLFPERDVDRMDFSAGRGMWQCDKCARIAFNWPIRDDCRVIWFKPEDENAAKQIFE